MARFPSKIYFLQDDNEAELLCVRKTKSGTEVGDYLYTKSKTKLGFNYPFEIEQISKLLRDGMIKVEYENA